MHIYAIENYAPDGYMLHDIIPLETVCHIFVCLDTTQTGNTDS